MALSVWGKGGSRVVAASASLVGEGLLQPCLGGSAARYKLATGRGCWCSLTLGHSSNLSWVQRSTDGRIG